MPGPESTLRRIERRALVIWALIVAAAAVSGAGWSGVSGAAGGGLLVAVSHRGVRSVVDALVAGAGQGPGAGWHLVKFITRYGILAFIAWAMMVRLRAHPLWLFGGASSLVVSVALESVRVPRTRP
ncbi:MAG: hypothetical protein AB7G23_08100 [Vicinamibacterales bacterium]